MATSARLEELKQKFNENPRRYFAPLANEHRKLGDLGQAIALCRTHLPQQPQHVSGHIVLAQALFEAGEVPDARGAFEVALDLDPENLIALRFLGDIARQQGEPHTARQWYERVLDADPRNDEIARLIRDLEHGVPAPPPPPVASLAQVAAQPEPEPAAAPEAAVDASAPHEYMAHVDDSPVVPIEDLAVAWQHEVAALDGAPSEAPRDEHVAEAEPREPESASPFAERVEPVSEPEPRPAAEHEPSYADFAPEAEFEAKPDFGEPDFDAPPAAEPEPEFAPPALHLPPTPIQVPAVPPPNESWAEPDEEFVASVPEVVSDVLPAPPPFKEIDYSMFEAVADEEPVAAAAPSSVPEPEVADEPPGSTDDWFAPPQERETEPVGEHAFDLDAAFQQVLPNKQDEVGEESVGAEEPAATEYAAQSEWSDNQATTVPDESLVAVENDGVDDAFATLDSMTANLEADVIENVAEEEGDSYVAPEYIAATQHVDALIGRTPDTGVPVVEEPPAAFVTETMAELYLQQGFREEALAVYRQLLALNPDDAVLAGRVRALEGATAPATSEAELDAYRLSAPAEPHADAAGQSMRAFLSVFARRRAPMRRRARISDEPAPPQAASSLGALFGAPQTVDVNSAAVLAGAFAEPNADSEPLPGRPTRAAAEELSLGDVFGGGSGDERAASFDEFFSTGSADNAAPAPLDEEGSDMVQFTAWLEGLKKK